MARPPSGDRPVKDHNEDTLGRRPFVRLLATELLSAPTDAGFVLGLTGPWGTGKTSVLHLIEEEIRDQATVVWFNPWLFAGAEQLVASFFAELGGQLKKGRARPLRKIGSSLADYAEIVAPAAGVVLGPLAATLALPNRLRELAKSPVRERYDDLREKLQKAGSRIVVFIDDFDRLTAPEVREVVRLVKLVGDLPYVTYVLAYDQTRIERALDDEAESGRSYLDKIVQAPHALPAISRARLRTYALEELQAAVEGRELHHFDEDQWALLAGPILGYIDTIRAAKRYANLAPTALDLVNEEVAAHDVLALTALRVFEPDVHAALGRVRVELTGEKEEMDIRDQSTIRAEWQKSLESVMELATRPDTTRELLRALFPSAPLGSSSTSGGSRWSRAKRRVATKDVLDAYLHASLDPAQIPTSQVEQVLAAMNDPPTLRSALAAIPDEQLPDLLDRLRDHRERFPSERPEAAAAEFLRIDGRVPQGEGFYAIPSGLYIRWVVEDLIARLPDRPAQTAAITRLFDLAHTLSQRSQVIRAFATAPDAEAAKRDDQPALNAEATTELEDRLVEQIRSSNAEALTKEERLGELISLLHYKDEAAAQAFLRARAADDRLFLAIAASAIRRIQSSAPPFRRTELDHDTLAQLFGDAGFAAQRAATIRTAGLELSDKEAEVLELLSE